MQKHANLVDLVKSFPTNIFLQNLASIQKRTSPIKFAHLAEKSEKGSISNLSTKVSREEWKEALAKVGYLGDADLAFDLMLSSGKTLLTIGDFDVQAEECLLRGDMEMISKSKPAPTGDEDFFERQENHFSQMWRRHQSKAKTKELRRLSTQAKTLDIGATTAHQFKELLVRSFGSIFCAWRKVLAARALGQN